MKITGHKGFILTLLLLFWGITGYILLRPEAPVAAPQVTFKTIDGRQISLSSLKGKPVLINFWASSCKTCLEEMPALSKLYVDLAPEGLEIIGVVIFYDPPSQALQVAKDKSLPYPVAIDILADAARAFGNVRITPTSFLIDDNGDVVMKMLGRIDFAKVREKIARMNSRSSQTTEG